MSIDNSARSIYRFGEFTLDLDRQTLSRGERAVHLRPKSFAVLKTLLEHPGRLVTKGMLSDAAWKEVAVSDDSLAHCVAEIRRALGERGFEIIRTIPRCGYILEHTVTQEFIDQPRVHERHRLPARLVASIAFAVVAGAVLLIGAGLATTGVERSKLVANQPRAVTATDALPDHTHANSDYERGRFYFNRRGDGDLDRAEASFERALELDPLMGVAWAGLAGVYNLKYANDSQRSREDLLLIDHATLRAVSLAPESAAAHARRAMYYRLAGEPLNAQRYFDIAMTLAPDDVLVLGMRAGQLAKFGRLDEAIELQKKAVAAAPTSVLQHHNLTWYLLAAGRTEEAAVLAREYRALNLSNDNKKADMFVDVLILQGKYEEALAHAHKIVSDPLRNRSLAMIYHELGETKLAEGALARLVADEDEQAGFHVVEVLAQQRDADQALALLSDIISRRHGDPARQPAFDQCAISLLSPYLIRLRGDKRWQALYAETLDSVVHRTRA